VLHIRSIPKAECTLSIPKLMNCHLVFESALADFIQLEYGKTIFGALCHVQIGSPDSCLVCKTVMTEVQTIDRSASFQVCWKLVARLFRILPALYNKFVNVCCLSGKGYRLRLMHIQ
jgi:hypothetical protein